MKRSAVALVVFLIVLIPVAIFAWTNSKAGDSGSTGDAVDSQQAPAADDLQPAAEPEPAPQQDRGSDETEMQNPVVTIRMESGAEIMIELFPGTAPNTVNNFLSLARSGFYDGTIFHRVIPGFMIQGGDPEGTGGGGPGYSIAGEFSANGFPNDLKHVPGTVSMARTQIPDSAGSQFFIVVADAPHLDGQYAAFGRVTAGMEEVNRIVSVPRGAADRPNEPQRMAEVTVEEFGIEYPDPRKK
ncbi:MAG: peptidylprolyl isomerase [Thermaerobacterales bacterium]